MSDMRKLMSEAKFYESYSRYSPEGGYESWDASVSRVMEMHRGKYKDKMTKELSELVDFSQEAYKEQLVLGAQRALQFGGKELLKHNIKLYNCVSSHCDRPAFFGEFMYMLLCGAGAGFSVQYHHVEQLPPVAKRTEGTKTYVVEDSIEGWAAALDVLMSSYFLEDSKYPDYSGDKVHFDLTQIRPKGAEISGGFLAPGAEPLRKALDKIESILEHHSDGYISRRLTPIVCYDICMHAADAVISGGVRRSATISLFSSEDQEMLSAKTGSWFEDNPQRARSNNSAVIVRDEVDRLTFSGIMQKIKQFGEPGFIFTDNKEFTYNPLKLAA